MDSPTIDSTLVDELPRTPETPTRGTDWVPSASPTPPPGALEGNWRTAAIIGMVLVLVVGVVLRFWTRSALWLDEALTVNIARLPLHDLHAALKEDGAPPLYYLLLHFWIRIFGSSDDAVRSLSGVISLVTLPVAWLAGRRYGGRTVAWIVLALVASAPFSIYYGTETRMYSLVMLLTVCGLVAVARVLDRPTAWNLVATGVVTAALLYTQYWALYLIGTLVVWLLWQQRRSHPDAGKRNSRWCLGAVAVGCLTFVPWLPTFIFQARHTGTPWAAATNFTAIISAITGFTDNQAVVSPVGSDQGRLLAILYILLAFLALFGVARDRWHIELDIRTRPRGRSLAWIVLGTLFVGISGGLITGSGYSDRYTSVVFVPLMLLVAIGAMTLAEPRIRACVMALAVVAGLAVAAENITTQRTQASKVAAVVLARAQPGDVVAYCPDQLGPSVYRLTQSEKKLHQITFPRGIGPALVDWVDYKETVADASTSGFVRKVTALAGSTHRIWFVWASNYQGYRIKCETMIDDLIASPGATSTNWVTEKPTQYYEPMNLTEITLRPSLTSDLRLPAAGSG